jgi:hypothetical protein
MKDVVLSPAEEFQVFQERVAGLQALKAKVERDSRLLLRLLGEKRLNRLLYVDSMKRLFVDPVHSEYVRVWNRRERLREKIMEEIG